jgi:type I restriction enzyme, S subunit
MNTQFLPKQLLNVRLRDLLIKQISTEQKKILQSADRVSFLPMETIGEKGRVDLSNICNKVDVEKGYTLLFENDVLVAKITPCFENGKGAVAKGLINGVGFGTTELYVLTPKPAVNSRFLYYITASHTFRKLGEANMTGAAGQKRVPTEYINNFRVDLPPFQDQQKIAYYLDHETERIDTLIAAKKRLLKLLAEKKRSMITHAVTRGLKDDVPMKDSGVEWLGEIPAHWDIEYLKYNLSNIEQGWSPLSDNFPADVNEWGVLKVGAVNGWEFAPNENKRIPSELSIPLEYEIKSGDILVSRANTTELVGSAALVKNVRSKLLLCDKLYRLILQGQRLLPEYLVFYLRSFPVRFEFERDSSGASSSMQNISALRHLVC